LKSIKEFYFPPVEKGGIIRLLKRPKCFQAKENEEKAYNESWEERRESTGERKMRKKGWRF
jgi:hypothetical protein